MFKLCPSVRGPVMPHITQIAAMEVKSGKQFEVYTKPKKPITAEAQRVTGIYIHDNGDMMINGKTVASVPILTAIEKLCDWLKPFQNVILVAHNGRRFDFPVLMSAVIKNNLTNLFLESITGLVDSLTVFKKQFPGQSHKQEDLVQRHLGLTYNAHNALDDVEALGRLLGLCEVADLLKVSFSPVAVKAAYLFNIEKST